MAERNGQNKNTKIRNQYCNRLKRFLEKIKGVLSPSLVLAIVIHVAMIVIGSLSIHDCPVQHNIPVFLITTGVLGTVTKILVLTRKFLIRYINIDVILSIIGLVEFALFICGAIWVFQTYEPKYSPEGDLYCNKTAYMFALVYVCIALIFFLLTILLMIIFCCACLITCSFACSEDDDVEEDKGNKS